MKAHQDLIATKGKNFTKEKNKVSSLFTLLELERRDRLTGRCSRKREDRIGVVLLIFRRILSSLVIRKFRFSLERKKGEGGIRFQSWSLL
jgi:hypothetical protein